MKLLPLKDVFSVKYGVNLELNKLEQVDSDGIPFISRTAKNNGVAAFVKKIDDLEPNPAHTLSVAGGGSVLATFYQDKPYYSGRDLYYLVPQISLSKSEMLIYCSFIEANKYRFNYGRQANRTLGSIKIPHPEEVSKLINKYTTPAIPSANSVNEEQLLLSNINWAWFTYKELFDIDRGKGIRLKDIQKGETPFITSTDSNNGQVSLVKATPTHKANVITVNRNGSVGETFYQSKAFCSTEDVHIFSPKFKMNKYIALFLCTLIRKEKYRFNYGRKWGLARMKESKIKLPVDNNNNPDWDYIESYIKSLPFSSNL